MAGTGSSTISYATQTGHAGANQQAESIFTARDTSSGHHPAPNGEYERTYYIRWKEPAAGDLHYNNGNYTLNTAPTVDPSQFSWPWAPYFQWTDQVTAEVNCPVESR